MIFVPVPFSIGGAHMLQHTKWLLEETEEDGTSLIAVKRQVSQANNWPKNCSS
jgi:hypothetical protein